MPRGIRVVYYMYEVEGSIGEFVRGIEDKLGRFVRLVNPDEHTLLLNFKGMLGNSNGAYVIEVRNDVSRWFYLTEEADGLERPSVAYEYVVGKEKGLEVVFKEIADGSVHRAFGADGFFGVLQVLLWGGFLLLGYMGYRNDGMELAGGLLPLVILLSSAVEGIRRGYKKRERR